VDEAVKKRLANHQLDLDKELEVHRASLIQQTESLKGTLQRSATDYSIYAQKRHAAVADLYAAFLRAQAKATDRMGLDGGAPLADDVAQANLIVDRTISARKAAYEAFFQNALFLPRSLAIEASPVESATHFTIYLLSTFAPAKDLMLIERKQSSIWARCLSFS